jgi:hypothetical protein
MADPRPHTPAEHRPATPRAFALRLHPRSERSAPRSQCPPQMFVLLPAAPWGSLNPRPPPPKFPGQSPAPPPTRAVRAFGRTMDKGTVSRLWLPNTSSFSRTGLRGATCLRLIDPFFFPPLALNFAFAETRLLLTVRFLLFFLFFFSSSSFDFSALECVYGVHEGSLSLTN